MSLTFKTQDCTFIDHRDFINNLYKNVEIDHEQKFTFTLQAKLFCIKNKEKSISRKRARNSEEVQDETTSIKSKYSTFTVEVPKDLKLKITKIYNITKTEEVRVLSQLLFESTIFDHNGLSGGNNSDEALRCRVKNEYFFIPSRSRFFCGDVKEQSQKLEGSKFDIIIADPPWWNKYIRRLKNTNDKLSYKMMYNEDIASIPVKNLLSQNGIIAVWCTNSPSNITAVKGLIFPKWGVEYITTWYWLKVNIHLQPMCDFGRGCKKQPYERLILGKIGNVTNVPENHLIVSIPSALHSHKPPLLDLLKPFVATKDPQVLELFARYLLPNTTSVGFEPLKWQHVSLYDKVS